MNTLDFRASNPKLLVRLESRRIGEVIFMRRIFLFCGLAILALTLAAPIAQAAQTAPPATIQQGDKDKTPPRPKPTPGPRDGGEDD